MAIPAVSKVKSKSPRKIFQTPLSIYWALLDTQLGASLLTRILPGSFFFLVVLAKVLGLSLFLQDGVESLALGPLAFWSQVLYRILVISFFAIVVALFGIRKPILKRLSSVRGGIVAIGGSFIINLLAFAPISATEWPLMVSASLLMIVGQAIALTGIMFLGRCFGILPEVRGLVRHGPYRYIRHPLYLGEIITGLGMLLPILSVYSTSVFIAFCGLQYLRAIYEEKALAEVFPDYIEYKKKTWRIVPGLQ